MAIVADFETRSASDLLKAGGYVYSLHPTTGVLCLAWTYDDEEEVHLWHPSFPGLPERGRSELLELHERVIFGEVFEAHNAFFERCIWNNLCAPRLGWPELDPRQMRCSAAKAASFGLPRKLEHACLALGTIQQKDMEGHRLMQKLSKPRRPRVAELRAVGLEKGQHEEFTRLHGHLWHEKPEELQRMFEYCRQDVRSERDLSRQLRDPQPAEQEVWHLDQEINWRGVHVDRAGVEKALALAEEEAALANTEMQDITFGAVPGCTKRIAFKEWIWNEGFMIPDTQGTTIDRWVEKDLPEHVHRALELWKQTNRTSTKKYASMLARLGPDDRVRDILRYWGGHTGRWAGVGIQPQNFPRGSVKDMEAAWEDVITMDLAGLREKYGDPMGLLSDVLRGAICAAPGHELVVADFASIEARVLFWIAGERRALQVLADGKNIYKDMTGAICAFQGRPLDDPQQVQKGTLEYQLGKQAILGLGYQMGGPKFVVTCDGYGIDVSEEFGAAIVKLYRETYPAVPRLWYAMEEAAIEAVRRGPRARHPVRCKNTAWAVRGRFLHCKLPGGRLLSYCDPRVVEGETPWGAPCDKLTYMGVDTYTKQWSPQKTYGGKLVENVVQAASRDLMAEAMLKCPESGYTPILTVHDEIVCEVPEGEGAHGVLEAIMADVPDWADGCPVEAEGWTGRRYRK